MPIVLKKQRKGKDKDKKISHSRVNSVYIKNKMDLKHIFSNFLNKLDDEDDDEYVNYVMSNMSSGPSRRQEPLDMLSSQNFLSATQQIGGPAPVPQRTMSRTISISQPYVITRLPDSFITFEPLICGPSLNPEVKDVKEVKDFRKIIVCSNCPICLEKLEDNCGALSCGHIFHEKCIAEYKKSNSVGKENKCPNCRKAYE